VESRVKSCMTGAPVFVEVEAAALAALDLMVEHGIRHLPVVDAERRVAGVVSFDDLRAAFPVPLSLRRPPAGEERGELRDLSVLEVMTHAPFTVTAHTTLEDAATQMVEQRIGCLPVVDDRGHLEGILTESDLLQALVTVLWADRRARPGGETLAAALRAERDRLAERMARRRAGPPLGTGEPCDEAEEGAQERDAFLGERLAQLADRRLEALDRALERAERGELARCEDCGGPIPEGRLRALPGTTRCTRCARRAESAGA